MPRHLLRTALALLTATCATTAATLTGLPGLPSGPSASAQEAAAGPATAAAPHAITLITGDRVSVDAKGRVVGIERARGREHVPFQLRRTADHTLVVPTDAAALIAAGRLDQRLFDITELNKPATRAAQRGGVKVIVGYRGAATAAKADVRDAATVRRTLKSLDAQAVQVPKEDTGRLWDAVTDDDGAAPGVAHVWLDAVRTASLDTSVPQIGAPTAWQAGYTGKGVKVAVLDTGMDSEHPDLKGQLLGAKNFTSSPDTADRVGHGTHVASTVAGTGAKSGGKYKGVAPDAKLLVGKVLGDDGSGDDSSIIAGMEWAAEQGADIVNLSLGATDYPGIDPLEAEVNKLSEQKGILFAIAAGNDGEYGEGTVGSPGAAADALTVGAVDVHDKLADFSSRGPVYDGSVKPDVTAPGVDITAASAPGSLIAKEYGENPPGYTTISGTSMATPHVAGAAALLKQEHPDWGYSELKSALMGSAKAGDYTPYQQGSGRIAVDKAITQTVLAEQSSLAFGIQQWPHTDDTPVTRQLTYRNSGGTDVTLALSSTAVNPNGRSAPAGFLTLGATSVTVPAGGTASVPVTVDTRLGGTLDGAYAGYVVATGGGRTVRTTVGVEREEESYDVKLKYVNRPGQHPVHLTSLTGYTGLAEARSFGSQTTDDTVTLRVPRGKYLVDSVNVKDTASDAGGVDWLTQPVLNVTGNTTVTLDLTRTKASDITVPDRTAKPVSASLRYTYDAAIATFGVDTTSFANVRTAHVGAAVSSGLTQSWFGQWTKGPTAEYDVFTGGTTKTFKPLTKHYRASELATIRTGLGSSVKGRTGAITLQGELPYDYNRSLPIAQKLPGIRTLHVSGGSGVYWTPVFNQYAPKPDAYGNPVVAARYLVDRGRTYKGGKSYAETFNRAVFAPMVTAGDYGVFRNGNEIFGALPLFADSSAHAGSTDVSSARTTLYRNGVKVGTNDDPLLGAKEFTVPSAKASYRLTTSVRRSPGVSTVSSRVDAAWTFTSSKSGDVTQLPVSTLRIAASTDLTGHATARRKVSVPVTVQGAAAGRNLEALTVWISYDAGRHWTKTAVSHGRITYKNPAKGKSITFKYKITDKKGNTSTVSVRDAYFGK